MTAFSLALAAALLTNGDFEMTSDVWRLHDNYRVERGAGRNLTKALVFHRERSSRETSFPTQTVELEKGEQYRFSAWIRTEKLETEGLGASVCVEWHDKDGTYLGGGSTEGVKGTSGDWRHVEGVTSAIPDAAASCHVAVYVSEGAVGTAWCRRRGDRPVPPARGQLAGVGRLSERGRVRNREAGRGVVAPRVGSDGRCAGVVYGLRQAGVGFGRVA